MLVGISATYGSPWEVLLQHFEGHGFRRLRVEDFDGSWDKLEEHATRNYEAAHVIADVNAPGVLERLEKRPFFVHVSVDAPIDVRLAGSGDADHVTFMERAALHDSEAVVRATRRAAVQLYVGPGGGLRGRLAEALDELLGGPLAASPLRPAWDVYFMQLARLAASRSNCMKRRVGCVIVRACRVIATGYNGTPRHLRNCHDGGCARCNGGGSALHTCLCLHAEENALLEAGRERVGEGAVLYCDTCPCLTCSVKIVQTGITEVVYSQTYRMDSDSFKVLRAGGVKVRQLQDAVPPHFLVI
ncbi:AFR023Wp [Eremothecium gossypii ATCC 10895]|uniref:Deoxycytidylate deaminase n=1 Tax=Eremothecium gossypii (strain ATCC 10895 / CBS 109.51 / FGSC 9923 / NRRL Y-1056) TaxID=284811 RepID=Q754P9_EREGS|nr:AFR023Wp [Eremothecium gossypii ATCC 10895]AAS53394.1 AFR023Wp [Eremothecium gossypii ATCC 10895]AEY97705.1 FAFR023Wp [Eremothecium gossypii FDAG1]